MKKECPYFETCSAPLCPLDQESLEDCFWYPDEEICKSQKHNQHNWIRRQRKIIKGAKTQDTYYTYKMLKRNCVIKTGIVGLSPDDPPEQREIAETLWMTQHPVIKPPSEAEKKRLSEMRRKLQSETSKKIA